MSITHESVDICEKKLEQITTYSPMIWPKFMLLTCGLKFGTLLTRD